MHRRVLAASILCMGIGVLLGPFVYRNAQACSCATSTTFVLERGTVEGPAPVGEDVLTEEAQVNLDELWFVGGASVGLNAEPD